MNMGVYIGGNTVEFNCGIVSKGERGGIVFAVQSRDIGVNGEGSVARRAADGGYSKTKIKNPS